MADRTKPFTMTSSIIDRGAIIAGLMSGTSLDGVDIALCRFDESRGKWKYEILAAKTYRYPSYWQEQLKKVHTLSGEELIALDRKYGDFLGDIVIKFRKQTGITPSLIASHGHTVFHNPKNGYTFQMGHGANIACRSGIQTISDFRSNDIALKGQGAPLVPIGDELLFSEYDSCLNLGGFANISFRRGNKRLAFDICPVNIVLNELAQQSGLVYDKDGKLGEAGHSDNQLLSELNRLSFYADEPPKSLAREWLEKEFLPVFLFSSIRLQDKLATVYEHVIFQIIKIIDAYKIRNILVTGGGAFNKFLMKGLKDRSSAKTIIPDELTVKFKEALIFAFLGLFRFDNQINTLSSVTGAKRNSTGGNMYTP